MGYTGLVDINDELLSEEGIETLSFAREPLIRKLIDDFGVFYKRRYGIVLLSIENVALTISYNYFRMCYKHIKPVIEDKSSRYKMASLMELIIVQNQVLMYPGGSIEKNREINALFGISAAFSLINCMIEDTSKEFFCNTNNAAVNAKMDQLIDDHQL